MPTTSFIRGSGVHRADLPHEAGIAVQYRTADLADAYAVTLPPGTAHDPQRLARFLFAQPSAPVAALMRLRDLLVSALGLKTAASLRAASSGTGDRIGIFRVYSCNGNEVVMGEDDRHLDFRVSVLLQQPVGAPGAGTTLVVSSVVRCHNRLGRIYLFTITPFHRLIVPAMLRRAQRAGWPRETGTEGSRP
jgi:hypothetical protein